MSSYNRPDICGNCQYWAKNRDMTDTEFKNRLPTSILWKCQKYAPGKTDEISKTVVGNAMTESTYGCGDFAPDTRIPVKKPTRKKTVKNASTQVRGATT